MGKNFCKLIKPLERERWSNPLKFCDKIRVCSLSKPRDINLSIFQNTVRWIFWLPGTLPLSNFWRAGMFLHLSTYFPHFTLHTCTQFLFPFKIISLFSLHIFPFKCLCKNWSTKLIRPKHIFFSFLKVAQFCRSFFPRILFFPLHTLKNDMVNIALRLSSYFTRKPLTAFQWYKFA